MPTHVTGKGGARPYWGPSAQTMSKVGFFNKIWFLLIKCLFLIDFLHFWGILGIFGGQILGGSWGCETNSIPI
jgi:hypothetical protein